MTSEPKECYYCNKPDLQYNYISCDNCSRIYCYDCGNLCWLGWSSLSRENDHDHCIYCTNDPEKRQVTLDDKYTYILEMYGLTNKEVTELTKTHLIEKFSPGKYTKPAHKKN